jgi:Zn ribbon nucleic-acid-binding protein
MTSDEQEFPQALEPKVLSQRNDGMEYYWCVNCGHHGKFKFRRQNMQVCTECGYDSLTQFELDEILEDEHLKSNFKEVLP